MKTKKKIEEKENFPLDLELESENTYPLDMSSYDNFISSIENADTSFKAILCMPDYGDGKWKVACYDDFRKTVKKYDRKIREDVHDAINDIIQDPSGKYCSSIHPLGRRLKHNWKYKLRDGFRIVYNFNTNAQEILIKAIGAKTDKFYENI